MAGSPAVEARIHAGDVAFDASDAALLQAIDDHGSINTASGALGRSFAHAQRRVVALEEAFGPLVERTRGGAGGGGSSLTDRARELLARFDRLAAEGTGLAEVHHTTLPGRVVDRAGELGTVATEAGPVRALVPADADAVSVSVRSDAVTLHEPPGPEGTSALNRFEGTVEAVDEGEAIVEVTLDVDGGATLRALLTRESASSLAVSPGRRLVATFKATATRSVPGRGATDGSDPA